MDGDSLAVIACQWVCNISPTLAKYKKGDAVLEINIILAEGVPTKNGYNRVHKEVGNKRR